jgi:integrase
LAWPCRSLREFDDSLASRSRVTWDEVRDLGKLRLERLGPGGRRYFLDFRPFARIYSDRDAVPFRDEEHARAVLNAIRTKLTEHRALDDVLAEYMPARSKPNQVQEKLARWLTSKRREVEAGDRSPSTLREYERYCKPDGHFAFWWGRSISEIRAASLHEWAEWLIDQKLGPKTRKNVMGAFHAFLSYLRDREEIDRIPSFHWPRVPEHSPKILAPGAQDAVLQAIPESRRGPFYAMADMGLRPGEVRALDVADFDFEARRLTVARAVKGPRVGDPIRETKTGAVRRLPVTPRLAAWIQVHVDRRDRLRGRPLFINPATGTRYTHSAFRRTWGGACQRAGVPGVCLYEGTKHSFATDAVRRGVPERLLQRMLGHRDVASTRRYAVLGDEALVHVLAPRAHTNLVEELSPGCPWPESTSEKPNQDSKSMVEAAGIEPASEWRPAGASTCVVLDRFSARVVSRTGVPGPVPHDSRPRLRSDGAPGTSLLMTPATPQEASGTDVAHLV